MEGRALLAHLAVSIFGAGVAADVTAGPRSDSEVAGLGDSDYLALPYLAVIGYNPYGGTPNTTDVYASATWHNSPLKKDFFVAGTASSAINSPASKSRFGTDSNQQNPSVGSPITLTIEPDPDEVAGQPLDVTLTSYENGANVEPVPAVQMSYSIGYGDDRDNFFGGILDSSGPTTSINSTRTVILHERIGDTLDFTVVGEVDAPAASVEQSFGGVLSIDVTATLGAPGPAPSGSGSTSSSTSGSPLIRVQSVSASRAGVLVFFSGPLTAPDSPAAYQITVGGRTISIQSIGGSPTEADLHLARRLRAGQKIVVTIQGAELRDGSGREVDAASDGVAGSTGEYSGTPVHIGMSGHPVRHKRHHHG